MLTISAIVTSVMFASNVATGSIAPITHREFFVESAYDGLEISVLEVAPAEKPKAVVLLAHGLCGCKERFLPFMEYLAMNGIACVANDHRGHGSSIRSEEDRGYTYQGGAKAVVMDMVFGSTSQRTQEYLISISESFQWTFTRPLLRPPLQFA